MIAARRLQRSFADGLIAGEVKDLWEPWMKRADEALNDDRLLEIIQEELSKRCKKSKTRGRPSTPAEVVLRMLLLKHMRGWSYKDVTREVRANLVYREFTGVGGGKVPDDKTTTFQILSFSLLHRGSSAAPRGWPIAISDQSEFCAGK